MRGPKPLPCRPVARVVQSVVNLLHHVRVRFRSATGRRARENAGNKMHKNGNHHVKDESGSTVRGRPGMLGPGVVGASRLERQWERTPVHGRIDDWLFGEFLGGRGSGQTLEGHATGGDFVSVSSVIKRSLRLVLNELQWVVFGGDCGVSGRGIIKSTPSFKPSSAFGPHQSILT